MTGDDLKPLLRWQRGHDLPRATVFGCGHEPELRVHRFMVGVRITGCLPEYPVDLVAQILAIG